MSSHSTILVDEKVLTEVGVPLPWRIAQLDLGLMASLAGRERTEAEWRNVARAADLEVREVLAYNKDTEDHLLVFVMP